MARLLLALAALVVCTACGEDAPSVTRDLAVAVDLARPADLGAAGMCPAATDISHICNAAAGYCRYRNTSLACVVCAPAGCVGKATTPRADGGALDFICVLGCNVCQPEPPTFCFTE